METYVFWLALVSAIGTGLVAGAFYAFSSFVMPGLAGLSTPEGVRAMQAINITAVTPAFMAGFIGTALISAAAVVTAIVSWGDPESVWLLVGGAAYLVGCFGVTIAANVPRNDALAKIDTAAGTNAGELPTTWTRYVREWTTWNHVRTLAAVVAMVAFVLALVAQ